MVLSSYKNNTSFEVEEISMEELTQLRALDMEEEFDFEEIKKYVKLNKKLTNV